MKLPDQKQDNFASVAKNLYRRHTQIIMTMIGSFAIILLLALYYAPQHDLNITQTETLVLPSKIPHHVTKIDPAAKASWLEVTVRAGDSLTSIFKNKHLKTEQLIAIMALPEGKENLTQLKPGQRIKFLIDEHRNILKVIYKPAVTSALTITRIKNLFAGEVKKLPVETQQTFRHGTIKASLFTAGLRANLPSKLIMSLVDIFQWDIDFAKDIRPGDSFNVLYEEKYINGEKIATGNILAAEFTNQGKTYKAIRYTDPSGNAGFYSETGNSLKRRFSRTPVKFTRISSYFKPKRWHPLLHRFRKHTGVDYAAPAGTPIKATGDGKIAFIGRKGGYGNAIIIQHGRNYSTLYGHMLKFAKHLHVNSKIHQGQVIGFVGMTGLATGPHLHYEFRINNKHRDPLKVKLPEGKSVPKQYRANFLAQSEKLLNRIAIYEQVELAANRNDSKHAKT